MKLLTILHSPTPTHPHTHPHTYTHTHPHLHIFTTKMPISAEQWRASVGAANASRRPFQPKRRWPCWEAFLCLLAALLVSTLLPGGGWRGTGSRSEYWNTSHIRSGCLNRVIDTTQCSMHCMCRLLHHKEYCMLNRVHTWHNTRSVWSQGLMFFMWSGINLTLQYSGS